MNAGIRISQSNSSIGKIKDPMQDSFHNNYMKKTKYIPTIFSQISSLRRFSSQSLNHSLSNSYLKDKEKYQGSLTKKMDIYGELEPLNPDFHMDRKVSREKHSEGHPNDIDPDQLKRYHTSYIKEQFFSFFQPSDNKLGMKLFGNKNALMKEKQRQQQHGKWIIHPCSSFR